MNDEVKEGFDFIEQPTFGPRKERRKNVLKLRKLWPILEKEVKATQEAFDNNFPGLLDSLTDEDRWELLEEENKTRKSLFYKRLFQVELYYTAVIEYLKTNGKKDILQDMNMKITEEEIKTILDDKLADAGDEK
jgi:hypothetical protein